MREPCPHCGGAIDIQLRAVREQPQPIPDEWLEPSIIAYRLGIGEAYTRKLCQRGSLEGVPGVRKCGGRWQATMAAIEYLRRV